MIAKIASQITKINKSEFNKDDKNILHVLREERLRELQPNPNDYQRIRNVEQQKYELQGLRGDRLKELSKKYYKEIEKEISTIDDNSLLLDGGKINNRIWELNDDSLPKDREIASL
ncbi:hypothetical protein F8M41_023293 [Gigaspora margarita]|uniref:Uncharacterized protein n=1 Tax=Gigaspora margarita TaxID=4874 RepID=A0A8H4B0V7_GIGMA|nr:hypothetical protein F8M41_023293 [Gigaspora margarita]